MIEMRLMITRRSAPAMSAPRPKAPLTTARKENKKSATANEPIVRIRRIFLRNRLAKINLLNFTRHLRRRRSVAPGGLPRADLFQDAAQDRPVWRRPDRAGPSARSCRTPAPAG